MNMGKTVVSALYQRTGDEISIETSQRYGYIGDIMDNSHINTAVLQNIIYCLSSSSRIHYTNTPWGTLWSIDYTQQTSN